MIIQQDSSIGNAFWRTDKHKRNVSLKLSEWEIFGNVKYYLSFFYLSNLGTCFVDRWLLLFIVTFDFNSNDTTFIDNLLNVMALFPNNFA